MSEKIKLQIRNFRGEKGEKGDKGDAFTYADFIPEQLDGLTRGIAQEAAGKAEQAAMESVRQATEAAAQAAGSASGAESAKTAAEKAQKAAESSASGAAGEAQKAQESREQAASSAAQAAGFAAQAGEAQKAAESAKSAAAESASLAQESAAQAAGSAESADSAKTAAAQSEQRTAASEANVAQAEERINKTVSGAVEAVTAQETKSVQAVATQGEASVAAVTAEGERVLGTIPQDYTAAVGEIDALKKSKAEIDDTAIDGDTWSSKHIADMLCPKVEKSGTLVQMDGMLGGYPLGVTASWTPAQEGSGDPSPENIRPIKGRDSVRVERREDNLAYTLTLPETVYGGEVEVNGAGQKMRKLLTLDGAEGWKTWGVDKVEAGQTGFYCQVIPDAAKTDNANIASHFVWKQGYSVYQGANIGIGIAPEDKPYLMLCVMDTLLDDISSDTAAIASLKGWLAAQYAAGTPVQIAYKLATSIPFTATGDAAIPALSGTNTVLTDADSVTVTGRADPIQTIAKLSERIAALEAAATNITE